MKLLITRSVLPHFYTTDPLCELPVINFGEHDLLCDEWELDRSFPLEISTIILNHLFKIYLKTFNFDLAGALVSINKTFANEIYRLIYGRSNVDITTKIRRVCNTLNLLEHIHDEYLTEERTSQYTMCRIIKRGMSSKFLPWDLVHNCMPVSISGVVRGNEEVRQYATGSLNGDNVWLTGKYMANGIYDCKRFKHPVINLEICNFTDLNMCSSHYLTHNHSVRQFVRLLRMTYGPNTGVHIMFNDSFDGNPFDVSNTGFIEF